LRYGRPFTPFQYALDRERWSVVYKRDLTLKHNPPELLYVGSIFPNAQLDALLDCAQAIAELNEEGFQARLRIATSAANGARFASRLTHHRSTVLDTTKTDDEAFFRGL